jgi:hypothetical protein
MNENPPTIRIPDLQARFDRVRRGEPLDDTIGRGRALLILPPAGSDEAGPAPSAAPSDQPREVEPMTGERPCVV